MFEMCLSVAPRDVGPRFAWVGMRRIGTRTVRLGKDASFMITYRREVMIMKPHI